MLHSLTHLHQCSIHVVLEIRSAGKRLRDWRAEDWRQRSVYVKSSSVQLIHYECNDITNVLSCLCSDYPGAICTPHFFPVEL